MVVNCEHVWPEISNYLDGEVSPELRSALELHFRECKHCTAILDGTRNVIHLYGDDRSVQLPSGFTAGWQSRLPGSAAGPRGTSSGWMVAVAALALISGSYALARLDSKSVPALRSHLAEPATGIPADMMVTVSAEGKTFHVPGCRFLHEHKNENVRLIAASEAIREGYAPCIRCLRQYLAR